MATPNDCKEWKQNLIVDGRAKTPSQDSALSTWKCGEEPCQQNCAESTWSCWKSDRTGWLYRSGEVL